MNKKITLLIFIHLFSCIAGKAQKEGTARIDSLMAALPHAKEDSSKVNLYCDLCFTYYAIDPDEGIRYGELGLQLGEKLKWKKGIGESNRNIGVNYAIKSNYPKALDYFFKALKIYEELGNKQGIARIYSNIGNIYNNQGDYPKTLEYYLKAMKMFEELGNKTGVATNLGNIGIVYWYQKDFPKSLEYSFKALKIYEELGDKRGITRNYGNIGNVYNAQSNYTKALEYNFKALQMERELGNKTGLATNLGNIGAVYHRMTIDTNKEFLKTLFHNDRNAALRLARIYLDSAITIDLETGDLNYLKTAYRTMSEVRALTGDYKGALESYKNYVDVKDSLYNTENEKKITKLQLQYEFDKKEAATKAEQDKKNALARQEMEKQRLIRNFIIIGMGLIVVSLILRLIQRSKIAKERRKIALEQERMRISRDLHDDLGSGLTGILMMSEELQSTTGNESFNGHIEKIKTSSRQMVEQMGEIVWAMNSKNDTLESLITYIKTYANEYFENSETRLNFSVPDIIPDIMMSGMGRRNIFLVLKESFTNISKYAEANEITFNFSKEDGNGIITLADDGKGFDIEKTRRFGNGLKNMQSRMDDIGGTFSIESETNSGTRTHIKFPLK